MNDILYIPFNGGSVSANSTRSIAGALAATGRYIEFIGFEIYCDSVTPSDKNLTIEICRANDLGTSTSVTPRWADPAQTVTPATTAAENMTAEPAGISVIYPKGVSPSGGRWDPELNGRQVHSAIGGSAGDAIILRITNPAGNTAITPKGFMIVRGA